MNFQTKFLLLLSKHLFINCNQVGLLTERYILDLDSFFLVELLDRNLHLFLLLLIRIYINIYHHLVTHQLVFSIIN